MGQFLIQCRGCMDFQSVRVAADELRRAFGERGIDVLCNNAGVMAMDDKATRDGYTPDTG